MSPKFDHKVLCADWLCITLSNTLENLWHISQVITVMGFCWCWFESFLCFVVNMNCILNYLFLQTLHRCWEWRLIFGGKEPVHNSFENILQAIIWERFNINDIEMSNVTRGDAVSTVTWRTHGSTESDICYLPEGPFWIIYVIPSIVIHPLPEKLNWRLSSIFLFLRHVQIINKDNTLLTSLGSVNTFSLLFHFTINNSLSLVCWSLSWETKSKVEPFFVLEFLLKHFKNRDWLSSTSWTYEEAMVVIEKESLAEMVHSNLIHRWNTELQVSVLSVYLIFGLSMQPLGPLLIFLVIVKIEQWLEFTNFVWNFLRFVGNWNI